MSAPATPPDRRHLRRFGLTVATGFLVIGTVSWWRDHTIAPRVFWLTAVLLGAPALIAPALLAPVERRWLIVGEWLGWINTRILLTALFYVVLTPIGLVLSFFRDPLDRRLGEVRKSYWIRRPARPFDAASYHRQF
jgi:hypothetical protein